MKKYYVTDNEGLGLQASQFINAHYRGDYLAAAKQRVTDAEFVQLNALYQLLKGSDGTDVEIIVSKFAKAWESALKQKFPAAKIALDPVE